MKRRGATINPAGRFEVTQTDLFDDGWGTGPESEGDVRTRVFNEDARSVISQRFARSTLRPVRESLPGL